MGCPIIMFPPTHQSSSIREALICERAEWIDYVWAPEPTILTLGRIRARMGRRKLADEQAARLGSWVSERLAKIDPAIAVSLIAYSAGALIV